LLKFFAPSDAGGGYPEYLTATEIKDILESNTKQKIHSMRKFGMELSKLFGKSVSKRICSNIMKVYYVIRLGSNSTDNQKDTQIPF